MNRRAKYRDQEQFKKTAAAQKHRYRRRTGSGYGAHEWTAREEERVLAHSILDRDLAMELDVSVQAIHVKRNRLKYQTPMKGTK